jgi:hypothetical protein
MIQNFRAKVYLPIFRHGTPFAEIAPDYLSVPEISQYNLALSGEGNWI